MATSAKVITNKRDEIQSKAQKVLNEQKEKVASTTEATKSGSTETPIVTETPKVTQTAKAMPSYTKPEITPVSQATVNPTVTPSTISRGDVKDLFASKTTPTLKKADTSNLLNKNNSAVVPTNVVKDSINAGGAVEKEVDKTIMDKVSDWLNNKPKEITNKVGDFFKGPVMELGTSAERWINDSEYFVTKVYDIVNENLGPAGYLMSPGMNLLLAGTLGTDKPYSESFQEKQGWYWDIYSKESELKSQQVYEQDEGAQKVTSNVSDFFYDITGNQDVSNMLGSVAGHVISTLKDPEQIASTVGYMAPALILSWASGGGFLTNTSIWVPSQTTNVYKDFSEDKEITDKYSDDSIFLASIGLGTVLSMVETFGDALGDMPWAKGMSRTIRQNFSKIIKSSIKEGLSKEITDTVDTGLIKQIKKPVLNALKKWYMGSVGEGAEEVVQDYIQTEGAIAMGSKRERASVEQLLTTFFVAQGMGAIMQGLGGVVNVKQNYDLRDEYKNFSNAIDELAPGINEDTKLAFFSAMITSQQNDANLSDRKIERYESQATKLYEERSMLEQRLKQADNDEVRAKINGMIEQTDNKIKEIDKKINQWNNTKEEINKYIEERNAKAEEEEMQKELEELHADVNQSIGGENLQEQDMENLSEQTMRDTGIELGGGVKSYQTKTPEFKNWFKNSQVVDKEGNPLVVYHGTRYKIKIPNMKRGKEFAYGAGMYFTTSKEGAQHYSESKKGLLDYFRKPRVMEVYLSIQNPIKEGEYRWDNKWIEELNNLGYKVNEEYLSREDVSVFDKYFNLIMMQDYKKLPKLMEDFSRITGYDGLMVEQPNGEQYWIAFRPEQIKSATENVGTFDVNSENIFYSKAEGADLGNELKPSIKLPSTEYEYTSLASALNQPSNTYIQDLSDEDLKLLHDNVFNKMRELIDAEEYGGVVLDATKSILKKVNDEIRRRNKTETTKKLTFKDAKDYVNKMIAIDKTNGVWSRSSDKHLRKSYMSDFLRTNLEGDFAAHLPGLKNVNLKQIKGSITDKDVRDIAEMLSLVSTTLGIDFNKVITDKNMSMNIVYDIKDFLYNTGALGLMSWKATKQMVRDLAERSGEKINDSFGADIAKMGVALTLMKGPMKSAATMTHELMHLIDFALSTEEGLPLYFEKDRVTYTSIIKGDNSWKTYTKGNYDKDYYNRWQEILARYAEQYFAYKNDKKLFDEFANRSWYWTEEEFMKLLPKFESFIKNRLGAKLLDEQNQFYNEIVRRINENKFSTISTDFDKEGLREDQVKYKLEQLKEEYTWIMEHIDEMTGTLKEEMETYVQLSNIQTNYEIAKAKGEEYLKMLKTTPEQQGTIDGVTTTVLPPEPVPGNTNPTPQQKPEIIRLGLPYYGGSNIEEGVGDIAEGGEGPQLGNSYTKEEDIIKIRKRKNKIKNFRKELGQAWKDIFTPTISRIYNISPRIAGRLITMETQKDINIHRYRQKAKGFVETLGKLKGKHALEVKMALLDYGALASEQGENIEQYKKEEVAKLKEVLLRNGFKEQDINDMFSVLDDIGQQYKDAGLSVTLTDMYFPRVVKDYEGLIDYMNRVSGKNIKVNKASLLLRIKQIQDDPKLSDEEKEKRIRHVISTEFKQPGTTSQHGKERKIGKLSDWGEGIYAYYESPIESIDHYIVTMTNAIQRQLFLGGLKEDANTDADIINQDTTESVSQIIGKLVEDGMINEEDVEELQKSILAVLNKKPSPKSVTALKDITYIATITNFLSAINQLDDLGMVILKDRSGLKHIVKAIFGRANIKYDDLGLEDSYEMFREEGGLTNWLFKKSLFNYFDRLGKTSFINAAWESMVRQSKNEKTRKYLYTRLISMYGQESADRMMEKIDSGNYMGDDGQIDIEILRDLLYQLGSTQPIYTSEMSTTYLNHPWARLCYALSSFTLKRIDWLVQGAKEVNAKHGAVAAGAWVMGVSAFLAMFGAAIGDVGDLLKGKKEETFLWNLINNGIEDALKSGGSDALNSWLKIWDLSDYDIRLYKQQGLWGVFSSKIKPFIFDLGKDVTEAITEHNADEITDLAKYVPIFGKLVYYWCFEDIESNSKSGKKKDEWDFSGEEEWDFGGGDEWDFGGEEEWDFS